MSRRIFSRTTPTLLLVIAVASPFAFLAKFSVSVVANPIPWPTLVMPEEYINVTICPDRENLLAKVDGKYPFYNVFYETVRMDYPLPPNATIISVRMNETQLDWVYNANVYPTVIGDWPMINWTILHLSNFAHFDIKTHYEHTIRTIDEKYTFLYAMGTGRFLETYAKETTAYVRIRMEIDYVVPNVYTIGYANGTWTWNPANFTIIREGRTDNSF